MAFRPARPLRPRTARAVATLLATLALAPRLAFADDPPPDQSATSGAVPSGASGAITVPAKPAPAPAPNAVTPPRLVHFEPAPYPKEAEEANVEGNVVLQLDIDRDGHVTSATVVQPAGHGFDEAAVEAAEKFEFEPARRGDVAIKSRILYRYAFTLTPKEAPKEAAPAGPKDALQGFVRAVGDVPLPGAPVRIKGPDGREVVVTTAENGRFELTDVPPGKYHVHVEAPGYEALDVDEEVADGAVTEVVYRLGAKGGPVEVTIQGSRPPREVTRRTIEKREIERIPGTNGDALRSLQNLPGVARPPGFAGLLIVRGSAPNDTQVFVDGTYVPLVYHFGGLSSVVPTEMLDRIDFYPGNFSAQYGRAMGGIVDIGVRSPNPDGKYHGMAQVDLIDARAVAEGPVPFAKGWSFIAGARRSWVDVWLKPVLVEAGAGVTTAPVYYDYQLFAETHPNSHSSLRIGAFGSDDRLDILIRDPAEQDPIVGGNIGLHTGFWRAQALYRNDFDERFRYQGVLAYGVDFLDFGLGGLYFKLHAGSVQHRSEFTTRVSRGVTLHTGFDLAWAPYTVDVRAPPPPRPGEPDPGPFAAKPPRTLSQSDTIFRPAAYAEAELAPNERAKIVPGVRVDYARDIGRWDLSPRMSGRYDVLHDYPRTTVKGGVGIYHQPPQYQQSSPVFGTPNLVSQRAVQYSLGVEQELTRKVEASVEGFYKDLDRLVGRVPNDRGGFDYDNLGTGYVVGAEVLLKYKPDSRFFGWLAYTLSRSVRSDPPDFEQHLFEWDQTHILTVLGSYRLGHGWEFGSRFRLVSGNLYTPVVGGLFNSDAGTYAGISGPTLSRRLPMFHQLDLRVDKVWKFEKWSLRAYLDVQNVYNRSNPEDVTYNFNYSQQSTVGFLPIIPSLGVRGEL